MPRTDVRITRQDGVATFILDAPPNNALGQPLRQALMQALEEILPEQGLKAIVIRGNARVFASEPVAGDTVPLTATPSLSEINKYLERATVPTVAALTGRVSGAGASLAMACHYRVASPGARISFPEVKTALLPEGGATQRLPRLIGLANAAPMMTQGGSLSGRKAFEIGLVDAIDSGDDIAAAARALGLERGKPRPVGLLPVPRPDDGQRALRDIKAQLKPDPGRGAAQALILRALGASVDGFTQGTTLEDRLASLAFDAAEARGFRALAAAREETQGGQTTPTPKGVSVTLVGNGSDCVDIALRSLIAGIEVSLWDPEPRNVAVIHDNVMRVINRYGGDDKLSQITRARLTDHLSVAETEEEALGAQVLLDLTPEGNACLAAQNSALRRPDLAVIHAGQFSQRFATVPADAIQLQVPGAVGIGRFWEFRLQPNATSPEAQSNAHGFARNLRKSPIWTTTDSPPIAARLITTYWAAADHVIAMGAAPQEVDHALQGYGFAMGPCEQQDRLGLAVARRKWAALAPPDDFPSLLVPELVDAGLLGVAKGQGYRSYIDGVAQSGDQAALLTSIITDYRRDLDLPQKDMTPAAITTYVLSAIQNVAARLLEHPSVSYSAIEVAAVDGLGFPEWRGGPLHAIDAEGPGQVLSQVWTYSTYGPQFWAAAPALETAVARMAPLCPVNERGS